DELLPREVFAIEITPGDADACNADLADGSVGYDLVLVLVENDDRVGRQWNADGHRAIRDQHPQGRAYRAFRGSIGIQDAAIRTMPAHHEMMGNGLPGQENDADIGQVLFDRRP